MEQRKFGERNIGMTVENEGGEGGEHVGMKDHSNERRGRHSRQLSGTNLDGSMRVLALRVLTFYNPNAKIERNRLGDYPDLF